VGLDKTSELEYHIDVLNSIYGLEEATTVAIECTEFCQAMADDTRQRILEMLLEKEMCVGDIVATFDTSQPTISHHLNILKRFDLVTSRREGRQVYYTTNRDNVVACCGRLIAKFGSKEVCEV
jgi:ArsR family transcriptional regulator